MGLAIKFVGGMGLLMLSLLIGPALGALGGACGATVVSWWFPTTMHLLAGKLGLTIWQLGASCGFFGGYLARTSSSSSSD